MAKGEALVRERGLIDERRPDDRKILMAKAQRFTATAAILEVVGDRLRSQNE